MATQMSSLSSMMSLAKDTPSLEDSTTIDEETLAVRTAIRGGPEIFLQERSKCSFYHKPITLIIIGSIVFLCGIIYTVLYFTKYAEVPYVLGPVFLSVGLMFLVTGLVWLPIIKETIRHKGILRDIYTRRIAAT